MRSGEVLGLSGPVRAGATSDGAAVNGLGLRAPGDASLEETLSRTVALHSRNHGWDGSSEGCGLPSTASTDGDLPCWYDGTSAY